MKSLDSRQRCDVIGHCLKVRTPDNIRCIGKIFDIDKKSNKKLLRIGPFFYMTDKVIVRMRTACVGGAYLHNE